MDCPIGFAATEFPQAGHITDFYKPAGTHLNEFAGTQAQPA